MSHVFHQLYFHFAWATHSREPLIDRVWRPQFLEIVNEEVKTRGGWPLRHNAMPDHARLLCRLPPTVLIAEFIGQVKGATSFRVNKEIHPKLNFNGRKVTAFSLCGRMSSLRSRATLIDRKNIIVAEPYLICWRNLNAKGMIGLKAYEESLLKEARESLESRFPGVNAWAREKNLASRA